jgi:molybdopterin/thiamine biosynthesis adenylyltransferase
MKPILNPIIIGAGGLTSYLLPVLNKSFNIQCGLIFDGDILEERNLDRQLFDKKYIGMNKAEALTKQLGIKKLEVCPKYVTGSTIMEYYGLDRYDSIICAVDNHKARTVALHIAESFGIPCFIGANEKFTAQAYAYQPAFDITDPRKRYPEIETDLSGDPTNNCTGEEIVDAFPQLPIANFTASALLIHLIWMHMTDTKVEFKDLPIEHQTSFSYMSTLTVKELLLCKNTAN